MNQHTPVTTQSRGFFKVSKFRLWSVIVLIALSAVTLTPWAYNSSIGSTSVINIMLVVVMVAGSIVSIIDLIVTRSPEDRAAQKGGDRG